MNERRLLGLALVSLLACADSTPASQPPSTDAAPIDADADVSMVDASTLAIDPRFYEQGAAACPDGGRIEGAPPPGSTMVFCELDGKTHGPVAIFDDDGRLTHLATAIHGEYDGVAIDFYPNGRKQKETQYVAGKMQGFVIGWHPDGSKAYEGTNVDDEADGTFRAFDASGKEIGRYEMLRGNGREVHWYPNGKKASEVEMVAGLEQGLATTWHPNGKKASEAHYDKGRKNGAYVEWDARGHKTTGSYADEREVGEWTHRDAKGAIVQVDRWEDGDLVSSIAYQGGRPLAKPTKDGACKSEAGLAKAYARQTRGHIADAEHCVRRPVHFPGVVVIGMFGHDRGCAADGAMVDCRWQPKPDGTEILKRAGWRRANEAAREKLALAYVAEIAETFGGDEPSLERNADGTYVVRIGVSVGPGMNGETSHWSAEYRITSHGEVTRVDGG